MPTGYPAALFSQRLHFLKSISLYSKGVDAAPFLMESQIRSELRRRDPEGERKAEKRLPIQFEETGSEAFVVHLKRARRKRAGHFTSGYAPKGLRDPLTVASPGQLAGNFEASFQ